jgi:hypothetical protein
MEEPKQQQKKLFIHIPQGCYAKITPQTPANVAGLITEGLYTCTFLVVTNKYKSHLFACHIDYATNIEDRELGLPAWINEISKTAKENNYINIEIHYQKRQSEEKLLHFHSEKIKRVLKNEGFTFDETEKREGKRTNTYTKDKNKITITEVQHPNNINHTYGLTLREKPSESIQKAFSTLKNIFYLDGGTDLKYSEGELFDNTTKFLKKWNNRIDLKKNIVEKIHKDFLNKQREILYEDLSFKNCDMEDELFFPPICCFDGTKTDIYTLTFYNKEKEQNIRLLLQGQYQKHIKKYYNLYKEIIAKNKKNFKLPSENTDECEEYITNYCEKLNQQFLAKIYKDKSQNKSQYIGNNKKEAILNSNKSDIFKTSSNEEFNNNETDNSIEDEIGTPSTENSGTEINKNEYSDISEEEDVKSLHSKDKINFSF